MNTHKEITILIPTINRAEYVIRALNYYKKVDFSGKIILGDSSNQEHKERILNFLDKGKFPFVTYKYYPPDEYTHDAAVMSEMIKSVDTDYCIFSGDDDILIPENLYKAAGILDKEQVFIAVNGIRIEIVLDSDGAYGNPIATEYLTPPDISAETGLERWIAYLNNGNCLLYSLHRKEIWEKMYADVNIIPNRKIGSELYPCSVSAISGKIHNLDCLTTIFHRIHGQAFAPSHTGNTYNLIMDSDWSSSIAVFQNNIVELLSEVNSMPLDECKEIFDREFNKYLLTMLKWESRNTKLSSIADKTRSLKNTLTWQGKINAMKKRYSLESLLSPNHIENKTFMQVYNSLIQ